MTGKVRYISQIISADGHQVPSLEYLLIDTPWFRVKIADTNADKILEEPLQSQVSAIGYGVDTRFQTAVVMVHNRKSASLHRYVNYFKTDFHTAPVSYESCDVCYHTAFDVELKRNSSKILNVSLRDNYIDALAPDGGVCLWRSYGSNRSIRCTLYDLLIFLCREFKTNVMQYEEIQFCNDVADVSTVLKLSHNAEAERF